ncbi:Na-translocating system protein MpsC family protein [Halobacillus massiliensis]|uniref:Na-translocating system protein MpsC family protein n=1 Tax=Halobacillus massiliensis TaxID=1926286 RepID=UPI0015C4BEDD|nr:Na-translocating system protein MpsC family protein [Halobacillus massiliensis]
MEQTIQKELTSYFGKSIRYYFGRGPKSVYMTKVPPFFTIQLRGIMLPIERLLIERGKTKHIEETRVLLMNKLLPEFQVKLREETNMKFKDIYYDWNFQNQSGMIWGEIEQPRQRAWPAHVNREAFEDKISEFTGRKQKSPENTEAFWSGDRTLVIRQQGILCSVEKEFINKGYCSQVIEVRRKLEDQTFDRESIEKMLGRKINDIFIDFNFKEDVGYKVLTLDS